MYLFFALVWAYGGHQNDGMALCLQGSYLVFGSPAFLSVVHFILQRLASLTHY